MAHSPAVMIAIHGPRGGRVCAPNCGYAPGLVCAEDGLWSRAGQRCSGGRMLGRDGPRFAADFVVVTRGHQFENLVPRCAAGNAVLLWLASGRDRRNGRERERKT